VLAIPFEELFIPFAGVDGLTAIVKIARIPFMDGQA
jgi:hypothetical protein